MAGKKAFAVAWPSEQAGEQVTEQAGESAGEPVVTLAPAAAKRATRTRTRPAAARQPKPQTVETVKPTPARKQAARTPAGASQLASLAQDLVTFVKLSPRPAQGEGQAPLNVQLPADDLAWLRRFSGREGLSQAELVRALVKAMRADFGD